MSKREFFSIFWPSFQSAFQPEVIESGWRQTGLFPLNPDEVLHQIKNESRPPSSHSATSHLSASEWRKVKQVVEEATGDAWRTQSQKLINSIHHLTTEV